MGGQEKTSERPTKVFFSRGPLTISHHFRKIHISCIGESQTLEDVQNNVAKGKGTCDTRRPFSRPIDDPSVNTLKTREREKLLKTRCSTSSTDNSDIQRDRFQKKRFNTFT